MSYKLGDVINDKYVVTRDFDSANGGQCQWGFAQYNGQEYFVKKFLTPVFPAEKAPGSEEGKQKRRAECEKFAKKQLAIQGALSACGRGGSVIVMVDFFRYGNEYGEHFFKVCEKINTSSLSDQIHDFDPKKRLFVMLTAAGALRILHNNKVVHLDLKPDNILIQEWEGKHIAKIIDFDSSILEGESISPESLVGDPVYYSPEFAKHIITKGETPAPTKKSDIFSLGLMFCQYWSGNKPILTDKYTYAYEAVLEGKTLTLPSPEIKGEKTKALRGTLMSRGKPLDPLEQSIDQLIKKMLQLKPDNRPSIVEIHEQLKALYHSRPKPEEPRLRINFSKS